MAKQNSKSRGKRGYSNKKRKQTRKRQTHEKVLESNMENIDFEERELAVLRAAVDDAETKRGKQVINTPEVKEIIAIIESFLRKKKLVCYGGTAINNILPASERFYNPEIELPDYDFYSPDAMKDAQELADIYYQKGFLEVEAKAGVHHGTYKVFVNFIPIADITSIEYALYKNISDDSIVIGGIHYAPPDLLRMAMYLELSRPAGDVGRWEKVLKRLSILNRVRPLEGVGCDPKTFQRSFDAGVKAGETIYGIVKDTFITHGVIFFGGFANSLYAEHMPSNARKNIGKSIRQPDFDVLSTEPELVALTVKDNLIKAGFKEAKVIAHDGVGEIVPPHWSVQVGNKDTVAFIHKPIACHSYNVIDHKMGEVKIATIDTILSLYLAFRFADRPYFNKNRLLCMSEYLFKVQEKNRLAQNGVLKRFSLDCYGTQETLEGIRSEKARMFEQLRGNRDAKEFQEWFLRYVPREKNALENRKKEMAANNGYWKRGKSNTNRRNSGKKRNSGKTIRKSKKNGPKRGATRKR